jgi:hypothetical protein
VIDREVKPIAAVPWRSAKTLWLGIGALATVALASMVWWAWPPAQLDRPTLAVPSPSANSRDLRGPFGLHKVPTVVTDEMTSFLALTEELAKLPELGRDEFLRVLAAWDEACPSTLAFPDEVACNDMATRATSAMISVACSLQAGPEPAKDDLAALSRYISGRESCELRYNLLRSQIVMDERAKGAVRFIKPG